MAKAWGHDLTMTAGPLIKKEAVWQERGVSCLPTRTPPPQGLVDVQGGQVVQRRVETLRLLSSGSSGCRGEAKVGGGQAGECEKGCREQGGRGGR